MKWENVFGLAGLGVGLLAASQSASAQKLSFGAMAGTNLTRDFQRPDWADIEPGSSSLIVGPMVELGLSQNVSVQVNALHRYLSYDFVNQFPDGTAVPGRARVGTWEFPILVKYSVLVSTVRPFLEFGPSFRTVRNRSGSDPSSHGITAGAGLEVRLPHVNIAPTVRYTRWAADPPFPTLPAQRDQVELLVGISHETTSGSRTLRRRKLWLGLVAGFPVTRDFHSQSLPTLTRAVTRTFDVRFVAGLLTEMELSKRLALEVNGLYRRLHFDDGPDVVVTWQIPVLAKYRFSTAKIAPFIEAGPSFRLTGNLNNTNPSHYGITSGMGLEGRFRHLKVAPVVRYTRWAADGRAFAPFTQTFTKRDQVEVLIGLFF